MYFYLRADRTWRFSKYTFVPISIIYYYGKCTEKKNGVTYARTYYCYAYTQFYEALTLLSSAAPAKNKMHIYLIEILFKWTTLLKSFFC